MAQVSDYYSPYHTKMLIQTGFNSSYVWVHILFPKPHTLLSYKPLCVKVWAINITAVPI